jgi:hypothetical protein
LESLEGGKAAVFCGFGGAGKAQLEAVAAALFFVAGHAAEIFGCVVAGGSVQL